MTESSAFSFQLPQDLYYDPQSSQTLVFFASDDIDTPIPPWLLFHPLTLSFYGVSPLGTHSVRVRIHAMNPITHDSQSFIFTLRVVRNRVPKLRHESISQ